MKRTIDTETLEKIVGLADGWINLTLSALRPISIIKMLEEEGDPTKGVEFLRTMFNQYCDQMKTQLLKAQVACEHDGYAICRKCGVTLRETPDDTVRSEAS